MTNGTIQIEALNLMGYTPETQMWFISNGGGKETTKFLTSHQKHFDRVQHMGRCYNGLRGPRIEKFRAYAVSALSLFCTGHQK
jgi:hypothetical protein